MAVQAALPNMITKRLIKDANGAPIQSPATTVYQDATGSPVISPKTGVGTGGQAFIVPTGAIALVYYCAAATFYNISGTFDGTAGNGYDFGIAGSVTAIPCVGIAGSSLYIASQSSTVTIYFHFEMASGT